MIVGRGGDKLTSSFAENVYEHIGPRLETFLNLADSAFHLRPIS